ncbi:hypothetical protein LTR53_013047 [Teratosphaeriaceae sp. CCFEE 6253]|nr:hypothetical protein LTR53_013047 [Teratosphaeriaceae sp. CCFEE 6253]
MTPGGQVTVPIVNSTAPGPAAVPHLTNTKQSGIPAGPPEKPWPDMIMQPDSSPASESQLTAEIKGIYAGLVIVEAKCINIDAAQACDPTSELDKGQWQALIALHRTLLYEHHDFLMATQHPSATLALKALPTKYSMPARMWKHGIHAFLEVLRHRRPASQDYMLSFIYLAYQMMALLYETVPGFLDTWIECLGDLARYRMAIEEDKEPHAQWGCVAASWYIKASDRHPQIGRLYHHLAILERPSLRKFACYGKSLTCVVPFPNAGDSLHTLCVPIAEEAQPARPIGLLSEASFCKLHALIFLKAPDSVLREAYGTAMSFLAQPEAFRWRDCGVPLAVANISALLGHGSPVNPLRIACDRFIQRTLQRQRPAPSGINPVAMKSCVLPETPAAALEESRRLLQFSKDVTLASLHTAVRCLSGTAFKDSLAFVGVMFCFVHFMCQAKQDTQRDPELNMSLSLVFGPDEIAWADVARYLNQLAQQYAVTSRLVQSAQRGTWPEKPGEAKPLPEDYSIRGLVWAYFSFCPGWFDTDEDQDWVRTVEMASTHRARADRVLYHGLRLAFETPYLSYDPSSCSFTPRMSSTVTSSTPGPPPPHTSVADTRSLRATAGSEPHGSPAPSAPASSASDGDYVHVRRPGKPASAAKTYAAAAAAKTGDGPTKAGKPAKGRVSVEHVKVVDAEGMDFEYGDA